MIAAEAATHVRLGKRGVAWIDDTAVKVVEIVLDHLAYGHSATEIHLQHPHLSMAQVHAALAYYYDNKAQLDEQLEQRFPAFRRCAIRSAEFLSKTTRGPIARTVSLRLYMDVHARGPVTSQNRTSGGRHG